MKNHQNLSLKDIRKNIDSNHFNPSLVQSFWYFFRDIIAIIALLFSTYLAIEQNVYWLALLLAIVNGNFFFALFVVGHDCGHGSFSRNKKINNLVGFISHQFLLTPYWAWKKSHNKHHRFSGNIDKDESIVPFSQDEAEQALGVRSGLKSSFLKVRLFNLFIFITGLNFHLYTIYNPRTKASHFWPNRVLFTKKDDIRIYLGTATTLICLALLTTLGLFNLPFLLLGYVLPIFICYHLMGLVTLMQHHHVDSNWYYDEDWDYVTGALNTFDYRYGKLNSLIRHWHHDIANYHVVHHLFLAIPHYNLKAVSERLAATNTLCHQPKQFSYSDYFRIIWQCNFVDNKKPHRTQYQLKPFEDL